MILSNLNIFLLYGISKSRVEDKIVFDHRRRENLVGMTVSCMSML